MIVAKQVLPVSELDNQLVRYLQENPITLNHISNYKLKRDSSGAFWAELEIWIDAKRFDECKSPVPPCGHAGHPEGLHHCATDGIPLVYPRGVVNG